MLIRPTRATLVVVVFVGLIANRNPTIAVNVGLHASAQPTLAVSGKVALHAISIKKLVKIKPIFMLLVIVHGTDFFSTFFGFRHNYYVGDYGPKRNDHG